MMSNVTIRCANCVGQKADSARFANPSESSGEVSMTRSLPDNVKSIKYRGTFPVVSPLKC